LNLILIRAFHPILFSSFSLSTPIAPTKTTPSLNIIGEREIKPIGIKFLYFLISSFYLDAKL